MTVQLLTLSLILFSLSHIPLHNIIISIKHFFKKKSLNNEGNKTDDQNSENQGIQPTSNAILQNFRICLIRGFIDSTSRVK